MNQHGMRVLPRSESPWGFTPQNRIYRSGARGRPWEMWMEREKRKKKPEAMFLRGFKVQGF